MITEQGPLGSSYLLVTPQHLPGYTALRCNHCTCHSPSAVTQVHAVTWHLAECYSLPVSNARREEASCRDESSSSSSCPPIYAHTPARGELTTGRNHSSSHLWVAAHLSHNQPASSHIHCVQMCLPEIYCIDHRE